MEERPILFSAPMVRAILAGTKTQTRRVVKPQPFASHPAGAVLGGQNCASRWIFYPAGPIDGSEEAAYETDDGLRPCPYGQPGDRLWVRETWRWYGRFRAGHNEGGFLYAADLSSKTFTDFPDAIDRWGEFEAACERGQTNKWKPSIHMPRWASRLTLEITGVRVERVQEISEADARAEGCDGECPIGYIPAYQKAPLAYHYAQVWAAINGEEGSRSWSANPWVWVVEFKRVGDHKAHELSTQEVTHA